MVAGQDEEERAGMSIAESLFRLQVAGRNALIAVYRHHGLSPQQGALLWQLQPHVPLPMGVIADQMGCEVANITGIVDRLEGRGLIRRTPGADRRVKLLSFTDAGLALRKVLVDALHRAPDWLHRLDASESRQLETLLRRAAEAASLEPRLVAAE